MLIVGYASNDDYDKVFHVGAGRIRDFVVDAFGYETTLVVYADGDELEKICAQFTNIPMTSNRGVRWEGESARFIINNLEL